MELGFSKDLKGTGCSIVIKINKNGDPYKSLLKNLPFLSYLQIFFLLFWQVVN